MSPKKVDKHMRVEIHSMAGTPTVLEEVSRFNILLSDGGWLGILPGHDALIAATEEGEAVYVVRDEEKKLQISSGILSLANNVVSILTTK